jgi:HAD superfamily hydrolase (TIGR01450 family)
VPDPTLVAALDGVRALVLDADGVLVLKGDALPGAGEALGALDRRGIPYRVVTNFSSAHRETLARRFSEGTGLPVRPERIITAASAAAAHTRGRHPGRPLYVIASGDARREWDGQHLLSLEEADRDEPEVAAVVIGDAGDSLTFRELDVAYRLVRRGAEFVAMHRNPWWLTQRGPTLDAGALVVGLEYSTGRRATVTGKPSPVVFRQAFAELAVELRDRGAGGRLRHREVAMVGDDPDTDVAAAQRVGLRAILVLTGKTRQTDVPAIVARQRPPDGVAGSLREVVAALAEG